MKKQYTITENNDWEGEVFGYILYLTEYEASLISQEFETSESMKIGESNYVDSEVDFVNTCSNNTYLDRLGFYTPKQDLVKHFNEFSNEIINDGEMEDEDKQEYISRFFEDEVFYKGKGLKRITKKKSENG